MIQIKNEFPLKIEQLEALLRRLPKKHEKISLIEELLAKLLNDQLGEQSMEYYYRLLEEDHFEIVTNIRLTNDRKNYFQIDTILLSTNVIIILEINNYIGTLYFDSSFNRLVRYIDDKEEHYLDPIVQVNQQQLQFKNWLAKRKFPLIPIIGLIVFSQPSTVIKTTANETNNYVLHATNLPEKILQIQNVYSRHYISKQTIRKIKQKIVQEHEPYYQNPMQIFDIPYEALQKGIQCPTCSLFKMARDHGIWYCTNCHTKSRDAHLEALKDYSLLVSNKITNRKFRDFLQLPSKYTAYRLLKHMNLKSYGNTWNKTYLLPF